MQRLIVMCTSISQVHHKAWRPSAFFFLVLSAISSSCPFSDKARRTCNPTCLHAYHRGCTSEGLSAGDFLSPQKVAARRMLGCLINSSSIHINIHLEKLPLCKVDHWRAPLVGRSSLWQPSSILKEIKELSKLSLLLGGSFRR